MDLRETNLDRGQCLALLASCGVGRLVYTAGALPAVLPLRYTAVPGGVLVLHPAADPGLARAVDGAVLAFEAGEVSQADGSGWSVTVLGRAEVVPARQNGTDAQPQPAGPTAIRLHPELVTGRSWHTGDRPPHTDVPRLTVTGHATAHATPGGCHPGRPGPR